MFVISLCRPAGKRLRTAVIILFAAAAAICLAVFAASSAYLPDTAYADGFGEYSVVLDMSKSPQESIPEFLACFGYECRGELSARQVTVPDSNSPVFAEYCELQRSVGLDTARFCSKVADEFTVMTDCVDGGRPLYAVVTVYGKRVIAAHLTTLVYGDGAKSLVSEAKSPSGG